MPPTRRVIVNADDFGQSAGTTEGIIWAHARGVVTSASLMVRWPAARAAAAYARADPTLDVGLHFDFGEWMHANGEWTPIYEIVSLDDRGSVYAEAMAQLGVFQRLLRRDPTHIDSHQHVHRLEPVRAVLSGIARDLNVPLREHAAIKYCGEFYGQDEAGTPAEHRVTVRALLDLLAGLPPGITELVCHPASRHDVNSMYGRERLQELRTLCDPRVRSALTDRSLELSSFSGCFRGQQLHPWLRHPQPSHAT
jgi:predicted glycoside hydrolase/deacetylase ChbG (UPF0249 family)